MRTQHHPEPILLACPECSEQNSYQEAELAAGLALVCQHCGVELVLTHDRDTPDGPPIWRLELPDAGDDSGVPS
jgi:DNA-directed RNA polymerase subunit RPC12/RpoP